MKSFIRYFPSVLSILFLLFQVGIVVMYLGFIPEVVLPVYIGIPEVAGIAFLQIVILLVVQKLAYVGPIDQLKKEIAHFLAGVKSGTRIPPSLFNPDLSYISSFFYRSLEILRNFKEEFQSGRILRSEVELAADIQRHVLKKSHPTIPSLEIVADTKSATEVGGDSYDIVVQGENSYLYLGDVTGHGVASGFVMMVVNALISGFAKMITSGAEILARTNEILKPRVKSNMLMSLLMVRWNESEKKLYMTGAGHEYIIVYKKSDGKVYPIKSGGVALGMTRDISKILKEVRISFDPGDVIVLYTDGITEARNGDRESNLMFGLERLLDVIGKSPSKTAAGIFKNITIELSRFMGYQHRQFDDITLMVIRYRDPADIGPDESSLLMKENITEWYWH